MYFVPEVFGGHDFGKEVDQLVYVAKCCQECQGIAQLLKPDLHSPTTAHDARELYMELLKRIDEFMK